MTNIKYRYLIYLIVVVIIFFVVADILLCFTPPIARDALIHHLAIPKLWLMHGGFYDIPWAVYSYYPMNIDLLYLAPLYFGIDFIPNFIHFSFAIGTALLIYVYLKKKFNLMAGSLGFLIFISTPVISKLSTIAYVDIGLIFFTTACAFAFIRWRDSEYKQYIWLLASAIAMGLALGTKYNALVVWFFLTFSLVFMYSRDTGNQGKALGHGSVFFIISLLVFSPWLIKNALLTGNPLYPLFPGIFNTNASSGGSAYSPTTDYAYVSIFRMREMLYEEGFWETISIPLRIFFQGQDDTPRYFDGVLNPILIVFVPFAFMNKNMKADKLFFLLFSIFIILVSFFLDQIRIRYILPAIPFLVILTVTGLMNILKWSSERTRLFRGVLIAGLMIIVLGFLSINAFYIQKYFLKIDPLRYILKMENRDAFISRHDASHPAMMYVNKNTPQDSKIRLILLAGRGYYLDRIYTEDRSMGLNVVKSMIHYSSDEISFQKYLDSLDCTHVLIRYTLFQQYLQTQFDPKKVEQLARLMNKNLKIIYYDQQYAVFRVITK